MLSRQAFVLVLSRIIQIFDRAIVKSDKVWRASTLFTSPFWFLRNIALPITEIKRLSGPVTEQGGCQRPPSMAINTTTTLESFGLLVRPFQFYRKLKTSLGETAKLSGFKSFRIQSSLPDSKSPET